MAPRVLSKIFACGSGDLEKGKKIGQKSGKCEKLYGDVGAFAFGGDAAQKARKFY